MSLLEIPFVFTIGETVGNAKYDDARATYRDTRFGLGGRWQIVQNFHAELEGGMSLYRRVDYTSLDEEVRFDPSPYVRAGLSARF